MTSLTTQPSNSVSTSKLIGISGLLGTGKDTLANLIVAWRPRGLRRYSFARPLKEGVKAMFGWTDETLEDRVVKELLDPFWGFSPRKAMQLLGTEFGRRGLREDVWLLAAAKFHMASQEQGQGTIISDVRFENEASWIREQPGSILIHIKDPHQVPPGPDAHPSEHGVAIHENDLVLVNDKLKGITALQDDLARIW